MGIIETCNADRRWDHFHSISEKSINNFSEDFPRTASRKGGDLRGADIHARVELLLEGLLSRANLQLRQRHLIHQFRCCCHEIQALHLEENQLRQSHEFSVCLVFIPVLGIYSEN
jgi:hypothetical protein